ncbi:MAG: polynucleotide adenylyltransferase PcnB [Nannocystaceae bacterium]|nr:polynucleotide adenylyltransferase PcnB [Nannocystaceae bacterium]
MAQQNPGIPGILPNIDPDALKVVRKLLHAGHEAYLVGGCVRDLYLGLMPKDFDIATSATPEAIRKLFRNSRIIGRRFKLAHVFFGQKVMETATFRTKPRDAGDDPNNPLITHDNEWGSVEDDARRRDFTINALFFDVENQEVVDFVDGLYDLDQATVRTIGEPALRFREDPVRMLRAIKFASRLDFKIEPATWAALLEVAPDIVKCSRARLIEEIYKLLRSGSARPCFERLLESRLLQHVMPSYTSLYGGEDNGAVALAAGLSEGASGPAHLFWRFLDALDDFVKTTKQEVANGVLQAILFAPLLQREMGEDARQGLDRTIERMMTPVGAALGIARRDRELARQILMARRRMSASTGRRRRGSSVTQRDYFHDALVFLGVSVAALGDGGSELARWKSLAAASSGGPHGRGNDGRGNGGDGSDGSDGSDEPRRRRRRGGRKRGGKSASSSSSPKDSGAAATGDR